MRWVLLLLMSLVAGAVWAQGRPLQPGDRLLVTCDEEPSLNLVAVLSASGTARMGILGTVLLGGSSTEEAQWRLGRLLRERRPDTHGRVRVVLESGSDPFVRYTGAVEESGKVLPTERMRLSDVVKLANPTLGADLTRVRITGSDGRTRWVAYEGPPDETETHNPRLGAGDLVFFERATSTTDVFVLGGVQRPRNVPVDEAQSVADAIRACGGLVVHANPQDVSVWRGGLVVQRFNVARAPSIGLQPGDTVRVGLVDDRQFLTVLGAVGKPGRIPYFEGMGYRDVLSEGGGALPGSALGDAVVKTGTGVRKAGGREMLEPGFRFTPGDLVEIPRVEIGSPRSLVSRLALAMLRMAR